MTAEKPYSMDANLFHISYEGGILEDTWTEPEKSMFRWTTAPEDAPDDPQYVVIGYEQGNPVSVDGERLTPAELILRLNEIGSKHGVGRVDIVENRFVGMKSRGVYETPGGTILQKAHRAVESITVDREVLRIRDGLIPEYAMLDAAEHVLRLEGFRRDQVDHRFRYLHWPGRQHRWPDPSLRHLLGR